MLSCFECENSQDSLTHGCVNNLLRYHEMMPLLKHFILKKNTQQGKRDENLLKITRDMEAVRVS